MSNLTEVKKQTVDAVEKRIKELQETGDIDLPENYSVGNALKSAWLTLQETQDKSKNPVLETCSRTSIQNALFDTVVQGMNPAKDQIYYIAYGNQLTAMRSYFGNMALAKRVDDTIDDIWATAIYDGDEVEIEVKRGRRYVVSHKSKWGNQNDDKVTGAYATVTYTEESGKPDRQVIMTLEECKQAWKQGKVYQEGREWATHNKFTAEMCKKTVLNRITKPIIKSSSDSYLFRRSVDRADDLRTDERVESEIEENANTETITIDAEPEEIEELSSDNEKETEQANAQTQQEKKETMEEIYEDFEASEAEPF
jgi:recombination protein RecT